jgi:hypothetical protein
MMNKIIPMCFLLFSFLVWSGEDADGLSEEGDNPPSLAPLSVMPPEENSVLSERGDAVPPLVAVPIPISPKELEIQDRRHKIEQTVIALAGYIHRVLPHTEGMNPEMTFHQLMHRCELNCEKILRLSKKKLAPLKETLKKKIVQPDTMTDKAFQSSINNIVNKIYTRAMLINSIDKIKSRQRKKISKYTESTSK